jgi:hypothetical protein
MAAKAENSGFVMSLEWLTEVLIAAYGSIDPLAAAWQKLERLRQGTSSVEEYATQFEQICAELGPECPNEAGKIQRFKAGLNNDVRYRCAVRPDGQRWTYFSAFVRCCALNDAAMKMEKGKTTVEKPVGNSNGDSSGGKAVSSHKLKNRNKGRAIPYQKKTDGETKTNHSGLNIPKEEVRRLIAEGRYLYCKEKGHMAAQCFKNPRSLSYNGKDSSEKQGNS